MAGLSAKAGDESKQGLVFWPLYGYMIARSVMPRVAGLFRFCMAALRQQFLPHEKTHPTAGGTPLIVMGLDSKTNSKVAPGCGKAGGGITVEQDIAGP